MGVTETLFNNLGDIEISEFCLHIPIQENICTFHVSVEDLPIMQGLESAHNLDEDVPYFLFLYISLSLLIAADFLENIAVVRVFHDQTIEKKITKQLI